jgi:hypothetical protein
MAKSYKEWIVDYKVAARKDKLSKGHDARSAVIKATDQGEYGEQVKFSVMGLGDLSSTVPWLFEEPGEEKSLLRNMMLYATVK